MAAAKGPISFRSCRKVTETASSRPNLSARRAEQSLKAFATAIGLDEFQRSNQGRALYQRKGWEPDYPDWDFLHAEAGIPFYHQFSLKNAEVDR